MYMLALLLCSVLRIILCSCNKLYIMLRQKEDYQDSAEDEYQCSPFWHVDNYFAVLMTEHMHNTSLLRWNHHRNTN